MNATSLPGIFFWVLAGGLALTPALAQPWLDHGPLRVSSNQRHLEYRDGTPFLWLGDTAWALFYKLNREEVKVYLDDRQGKGFNVIQAVAYWYPHGEDGPGPHNAPNAYGHRPFQGQEDAPETDQPLTVSGGSPDSPNDYWDHADFIVREIRQRGMYLALLPSWSRAFVNSTFETSHPTLNENTARSFGRFLGERYRHEPHLIWVVGGDINPTKGIGDCRPVYRAMAETIGQAVTGTNLRWDQPDPAWDQVLMTYHPDGDPFSSSSKFFHHEPWLDFNGIQTWKSIDKVQPAVAHNYSLTHPVKPTLFLEGAYEGGRYPEPGGRITDLKVRRQAWQAMLSGAAGHTYGASSIWHFQRKPRDTTPPDQWKRALQFPAAQQTAALLGRLLTEHQWWSLVPDQNLLAAGASERDLLKTAARSTDGRRILVYFPDATPARLKLPDRPFAATWIRPDNGERTLASGPNHQFAPPADWPDALLSLDARPRVVVTTDINILRGDPDDRQSLVHLLFYLDELDVKVITVDRSVERSDPGALRACELAVDAYARDYKNPATSFRARGYPAPEKVRESIHPGDARGVNAIVAEAQRADPRPLYILAWGTLRVLRDVLRTAPEIAPKLRVLSIGTFENPYAPPAKPGWNSTGRNDIYKDPRFQSLWWIENSTQFPHMFHGLVFGSGKGSNETQRIPVGGEPFELLKKVSRFGALGRHLTDVTDGNEWARYFRAGDTPSVLYLLDPNHNPDDPTAASWAGTFEKPFPTDRPNHWTDATWGMHDYRDPARTAHLNEKVRQQQRKEFLQARARVYAAFLEKLRTLYPAVEN